MQVGPVDHVFSAICKRISLHLKKQNNHPGHMAYKNATVTVVVMLALCHTLLASSGFRHCHVRSKSNLYLVSSSNPGLVVPSTFLELSLKAMAQLKKSRRSNILFALANGLGTVRDDLTDSLIPTSRMPMGLLEHVINFYQSSKV